MRVEVFGQVSLFVEGFLKRLRVLEMGFEDRLAGFQQRLQVRVLCIGDQGAIKDANDRFMIADFVIDVGLVELRAVHLF
jgi:hypothetical protein